MPRRHRPRTRPQARKLPAGLPVPAPTQSSADESPIDLGQILAAVTASETPEEG
ncbi:hypothetical protein [Parafrankia soli]|uniref:hypothetical protein n=1 Tax=Parafrankia soli TaxID=2599596 RepID=UPI0012FF7C91|nr:hypothetical protein [Parafrankia soli]